MTKKGKTKNSEEENSDEESELVEIIEEESEDEEIIPIDENKFLEFFGAQSQIEGRASAAVLEEVTGGQEVPVFFATGGQRQRTAEGFEDADPFKYAAQAGGNGEDPKYVSMSSEGGPAERIDFQRIGREQEPTTRNVDLTYSTEARVASDSGWGKLIETETIDPLRTGTQKDTEEKERRKKEYWIK